MQIDPAAVTALSPAATPFTTALVDLALGAYDGAKPRSRSCDGDYDGRLYVGFGLQDYSSVAASISTTAVIYPSGYGADSWPLGILCHLHRLVGGISATAQRRRSAVFSACSMSWPWDAPCFHWARNREQHLPSSPLATTEPPTTPAFDQRPRAHAAHRRDVTDHHGQRRDRPVATPAWDSTGRGIVVACMWSHQR